VDRFAAAHAVNRAPALLEKRFSFGSARFAVDLCGRRRADRKVIVLASNGYTDTSMGGGTTLLRT
jgi:hypothetical protein